MSEKSEFRGERVEWKPNVEFITSISKDGRFIICKTVITAIKPLGYFEKIVGSARSEISRAHPETPPRTGEAQEK